MSGLSSEMLQLCLMKNQAEPATTPSSSNFMGNKSSCAEHLLRYGNTEKVLIGGLLIILTVSTICGNLLLVLTVCLVKKLKHPCNYLIVSLAVADLAVAVAIMPFVSITDLIGGHWIFSQLFCNVFIAMDVMCCTASILTLCVISIDRYLGISKPLTYPVRRSGKCMAKIVLSVWLFSASITLPPLFGWAQNISDENVCLISQDLGYTVYSTAVAFYIPMCVMLIMYYRIYRAVKMSVAKHAITFPSRPDDGVSYVSAVLKLQREVKERAIITRLLRNERKYVSMFKREQKAATTLGVMVRASCVPLWVERTLLWLGYTNYLINPFINTFFNRDLRTTYQNLIYRNFNRKFLAASMQEALKPQNQT
ncbi:5-hydroxytryptamine receptor 7 [Tachysurus ichikawai]